MRKRLTVTTGTPWIKMIARLLVTEQDEAKRQILLRLLAEEEAKLVALDDPPKRERREN